MKPICFFLAGLLLSFTSANAQRNFIPGYMVSLKGDTIKGFINYKEWDQNPKQVHFKATLNAQSQIVNFDNANGFGVNGFEYYTKAIVKVSTSSESISDLPRDIDTAYRVDTAFLKAVVNGERLVFYTYNTEIKPIFYVGDKSTGEVTALKRYLYLDDNSTIKNIDIFRSQLIGFAMRYQPNDQKLRDKIANVKYQEYELANIVALINGYTNTKKNVINNATTRFFVGAGVGSSTLKFGGDVAPFSNGSSARSITPSVAAGLDFLVNKKTEKLIIRFEVTASASHFSITEETGINRSNSLDFKYVTVGFVPQIFYNVYSTDKFKVFLDAGLGFTLNTYNKYYFERTFYGSPSRTDNFPVFEKFVFTLPLKAGIQIDKHLQIFGGYSIPSSITSYNSWGANVSTFTGGINYLFK